MPQPDLSLRVSVQVFSLRALSCTGPEQVRRKAMGAAERRESGRGCSLVHERLLVEMSTRSGELKRSPNRSKIQRAARQPSWPVSRKSARQATAVGAAPRHLTRQPYSHGVLAWQSSEIRAIYVCLETWAGRLSSEDRASLIPAWRLENGGRADRGS
jgi:hypothetical protein